MSPSGQHKSFEYPSSSELARDDFCLAFVVTPGCYTIFDIHQRSGFSSPPLPFCKTQCADLAIAVVIVAVAFSQIAKQAECDKTPVDVLFLVDITTDNNTVFERQQKKLVETIRHLNDTAGSRDPRYGIIVFHRRPLVLVSLVSPRAKIPERVYLSLVLLILL
ncbi:unnamed protein product [Toxocara canis]|uniref:VWFA domain-containing protein n=1 Tax=Toxocara canis TaxID=6265 RepID=A0A183UZQ6_TOXCA|nr:unnamed protein product [Toxocara canis]